MADYVFILRSRLGRVIFTLKADRLEIYQKNFGRAETVEVALRSISPDYERVARRLPLWMLWPGFALVTICMGAYALLVSQDIGPREWAVYPAFCGLVLLWSITQLLRRFDCFVFRDQWNREIFSIAREENQAAECDAFIRTLLDRIEAAEAGRPPRADPAPAEETIPRAEVKWKICLGAGILAMTLPLLNPIEPMMNFFIIVLVMGATTVGLLAASSAFSTKERMRYWCVLGLALCVAPYVVY